MSQFIVHFNLDGKPYDVVAEDPADGPAPDELRAEVIRRFGPFSDQPPPGKSQALKVQETIDWPDGEWSQRGGR